MSSTLVPEDARIRDYLDDRLQTAADLESLDVLLDNIKSQQTLLRQQLKEAKDEHANATEKSHASAQALREKEAASREQQAKIQQTLMEFTHADTYDVAMARFKIIRGSIHQVEIARAYLELGKEAEALSKSCAANVEKNVDQAIINYEQLESLAKGLPALQESSEGAAPQLVDYVLSTAATSRTTIFDHLASELESTLKQIGWPKPSATIPDNLSSKWSEQIGRLLDLQKPELRKAADVNATRSSKEEPVVLAPLEILVRPLALRFQYHFSGERLTNRLEKPEYFLNHVLELIDEYSGFVQENIQSHLVKHYRDGDLSFTPAYVDATSAWITALMPVLRRKLQGILPKIVKQSNLFSNLINEVMAFDGKLADDWDYVPLSTAIPFRGLSHFILSDLEYFPAWFAVERDFALARYDAIISDRSTGNLDFDSVDSRTTKPSKAAIRVNDLLETITDRYRSLSAFHQKMKFLIDIQIAVFDKFHNRLHEGLEAYLTRTSTVGRTVHGVGQGDNADLSGTNGLDRICRVFGSAEYLEKAMRDWSEDTFFLDLWEELQYRSRNKGQIKGDLTMMDIAAKTSATITEKDKPTELQGALFDETAASYRRLRVRSESVLVDTITYDLRNALRSYTKVNTWASMSSSGSTGHSQTAELDAPVRLLEEYMTFLASALGTSSLRRVIRHIGLNAQTYLYDQVLLRHVFSTAGAAQFAADIRGLSHVFDRHTGPRQGSRSLSKLVEAVKLLSLPVKGETPIEGGEKLEQNDELRQPGLWEVERRVFASNESAREVLEDMGIALVSETEAREVLKKRAEIAS
ncbi:hypothetical protein K461DRAFT_276373 [Myriangium duriaei CBS 260.36]|uniref:RINT-1 family protein n=1 Tax=Myriangium duriaei CBS 260.36 TaxID=1168546 RepID=A0A9P4JA11_9PEZI|nr:hypothetical protein K461DRAFT_276373 [Myriangium duriaei CBS 260.36]